MDFASARQHMVDSQLRPNAVTDDRLVASMATVPREIFVPAERRFLAYADEDLTYGAAAPGSRCILRPMTFGRMVQLLGIRAEDRVLDVGCGTGFSCAILSHLA